MNPKTFRRQFKYILASISLCLTSSLTLGSELRFQKNMYYASLEGLVSDGTRNFVEHRSWWPSFGYEPLSDLYGGVIGSRAWLQSGEEVGTTHTTISFTIFGDDTLNYPWPKQSQFSEIFDNALLPNGWVQLTISGIHAVGNVPFKVDSLTLLGSYSGGASYGNLPFISSNSTDNGVYSGFVASFGFDPLVAEGLDAIQVRAVTSAVPEPSYRLLLFSSALFWLIARNFRRN